MWRGLHICKMPLGTVVKLSVTMEFLVQCFVSQHLLLLLDQSDIHYRVCTSPEFLGNC